MSGSLMGFRRKVEAAHPELPTRCVIAMVDGVDAGGGATGVRKRGDGMPVTLKDAYHLDSLWKAWRSSGRKWTGAGDDGMVGGENP